MSTTTAAEGNVSKIMRAFLREEMADGDEFRNEDLLASLHERFDDDAEFGNLAAAQVIDALAPQIIMDVMHSSRGHVATAAGWVSKKKVEMTAREKLGRLFENVDGGYRSILLMTKADGERALRQRQSAVDGHLKYIGFWREVLPKMKESGTVGETFTGRQLEGLWAKHFVPAEKEQTIAA